ncbi:SAM-dependent methyltransferase [Sphingopyxis sp. EG6]|nr:SAM-dependent methyltransferase [Sphingopyxis sp. EG6]
MRLPMMIQSTKRSSAARPHGEYKRQLLDEIVALKPATLLDVGCGTGDLLVAAREAGIARTVGIEPETQACVRARSRCLDVISCRAEALPFEDRSFDVVTLDYVAHHTENLPRALREASRVARCAVLILDCWFDDTLASQRVARRYDNWLKRRDRKSGYVHNACPTAIELISMFAAEEFSIDYFCRLILSPLDVAEVERSARGLLENDDDPIGRLELEGILDDARRDGISDDGCIVARFLRDGEAADTA